MKLPRIVRTIGKRLVNATPVLRRHILFSTDYRVLGGPEEARSVSASSGGWRFVAALPTLRPRAYWIVGHTGRSTHRRAVCVRDRILPLSRREVSEEVR